MKKYKYNGCTCLRKSQIFRTFSLGYCPLFTWLLVFFGTTWLQPAGLRTYALRTTGLITVSDTRWRLLQMCWYFILKMFVIALQSFISSLFSVRSKWEHRRRMPPLRTKIMLLAWIFSENLAELYLGTPIGVGSPSYGYSCIRPFCYHHDTCSCMVTYQILYK